MAIPVKFQQFKSAGVYRLVYDKSVIAGVEAELLRLVVGYSPKGPFNTPVYIKSVSDFKAMFGDISKSLEKRGCYFHRTCIQALNAGPILCLNLKKFGEEKVTKVEFKKENYATNDINVTSIFDTTRFWKLEPNKLATDDTLLSMSATDSIETTGTVFIRKAPDSKVAGYKLTLADWFKSYNQEIPDYLNNDEMLSTLLSDLFAEIYVFSGKFDETVFDTSLAKYFQREVTEVLVSSEKEFLAAISDSTISNITLTDNITLADSTTEGLGGLNISNRNLVLNLNGKTITAGVKKELKEGSSRTKPEYENKYSIGLYINNANVTIKGNGTIKTKDAYYSIAVWAAGTSNVVIENGTFENQGDACDLIYTSGNNAKITILDGTFNATTNKGIEPGTKNYRCAINGLDVTPGSIYVLGGSFKGFNPANNLSESRPVNYAAVGQGVIANISSSTITYTGGTIYVITDGIENTDKATLGPCVSIDDTEIVERYGDTYFTVKSVYTLMAEVEAVQPTRIVTLADIQSDEKPQLFVKDYIYNAFGEPIDGLDALYNDSASGAMAHYVGCVLPEFTDPNTGYISLDIIFNSDYDVHKMMMNINSEVFEDASKVKELVKNNFVLSDSSLNKAPITLYGYTYELDKPASSKIEDKLAWQEKMLNVLVEEQGIRNALLSQSEIDYRYIVDSFETFWRNGMQIKSQLSLLAKQKELCFALLNFLSVQTMNKYGDTFKNHKKVFDVNKVVKNLVLPSEENGASFCAFYTPLKFSDGYVDSIVPSTGLISNLFINKYVNRQPYSIIAGPNYSNISYSQLVGPDYHYSQEELHVIEPFGVNCLVYRPTFGTFINANQTAKQLPKTALSAVNVRELVIFLQTAIGEVLQSYQWEFNNPTTRAAIKTKADLICENAKLNGGIQQYLNVIDESNNTPDIIDNEFCVLSTHIEPGRGCGKMVHELTIYRTGGMSSVIK